MTTITQPSLNHRATTESLLAATLAAVMLLVVLVWAQTWSAGTASAPATDLPIPTAQAQVAPPRPVQQPAPTTIPDAAAAPTPQAQIAPPQPTQQTTPTT